MSRGYGYTGQTVPAPQGGTRPRQELELERAGVLPSQLEHQVIEHPAVAQPLAGGALAATALDADAQLVTGVDAGATIDGQSAATVATGGTRAATALDASANLVTQLQGTKNLLGGDLYVDGAQEYKVGSSDSPSYYEVEVLIPSTAFVPRDRTSGWVHAGGYLTTDAVLGSTSLPFYAPVVLPPGVTIVGLEAMMMVDTSVGDAMTVTLVRVAESGGAPSTTNVAAVTFDAAAGTYQLKTATLSESTSTGRRYALLITQTAAGAVKPQFSYARVRYRKTTLRTSI